MNNYQITKHSEQFADNSITVNPYMIKRLGINRTKCLIRVNDYQLACVPYSISLKGCRLLLILSQREQQIISDLNNQSIIFHLDLYHPNLGKNIPLFIRVTVKSFKQLNVRLNQCLLEAHYLTIPQDYREILLEYFLKNEENMKVFKDPHLSMKPIAAKKLSAIRVNKKAFLRMGSEIKLECRIIEISLRKAVIYIDTEEKYLLNPSQKSILELLQEKESIFIDARLSDYTPSSEVEGFYIVSLTIEYSSPLTDWLSKLLNKDTSDSPEDISTVEELPVSSSSDREDLSIDPQENNIEEVLMEPESTE